MDVCEKLNMKYYAHVFLPESAKGTSEMTQNAQFILRGLILTQVSLKVNMVFRMILWRARLTLP